MIYLYFEHNSTKSFSKVWWRVGRYNTIWHGYGTLYIDIYTHVVPYPISPSPYVINEIHHF